MPISRSSHCDVLIVGGGVGGVAAAIAATRLGASVILTEETPWIGGQLTSQAVPPDEHPWIEQFGCTSTYRGLRNGIRDYYKRRYPLTTGSAANRFFNPGNATVSKLAHEPRVALSVLESMIQSVRASGRLRVFLRHAPVSAAVDHDRIVGVSVMGPSGSIEEIEASYYIDATEFGDLLPLAEVEYAVGFEARAETGETQAPEECQPSNQQAFTMVFAVDHIAGQDHTIDKPQMYDFWKSYKADHWPGPLLGWEAPNPRTLETQCYDFNPNPDDVDRTLVADESQIAAHIDLWLYRRIIARNQYEPGAFQSDVSLVNWPLNDYWLGPIVDVDPTVRDENLEGARQLSLSLLYWLQTEAPRRDGSAGFPGLRLRGDVVGDTDDGLAMHPYVRESRRIKAVTTVTASDISRDENEGLVAEFSHSVGVGAYRLDLHPSTGGDPYIDLAARPFEIPLGSLIPRRVENLIAGAKNIGSTHLSNGSFRLQPVEWNIGEAAGSLGAHCARGRIDPVGVHEDPSRFDSFQDLLVSMGVEVHWPEIKGY